MAKKCIPSDIITDDASIDASSTALAIESSYNKEFGIPMNQAALLKISIANTKKSIGKLQLQLNLARKDKDVKKTKNLSNQIRKQKKEQLYLQTALKEAPKRFNVLMKIRELLTDNLHTWAEKNTYNIKPDIYFPIIKEWISERYGNKPLNEVSLGGLTAMHSRLNKILNVQIDRENKPFTVYKRQMQDPGILTLKQDPTGLAYDLVNRSRNAPAEIFGVVNKYNTRVKNTVANIQSWMGSNEYLFNVNIPAWDTIDQDTKKKSFQNMIEFVFDALDGRAKYVIAQPIGKGQKENEAFKRDEKEYNKIVRRNILDDINEGGEIQKYTTPQGESFYYVVIKQPINEHGGKEVYHAYQVPHKPGKEKEGVVAKDFLLLPRSTKKTAKGQLSREDYDAALGQGARLATHTNERGQQIQGRLPEGWHQANTYVPLEGTKKKNINGMLVEQKFDVFSYSDYSFNENINNTDHVPSQGEMPTVFWKFLQDIRTILKDFHTYATDKNRTTERVRQEITNSIKKVPNQKMTTEEFDKHMSTVDGMDGIRSNMYVNDKGDLITANTFFGELANYVPWRYTPNDLIVGLIKARDAITAKIHDFEIASGIQAERSTEDMTPAEILEHGANLTNAEIDHEKHQAILANINNMIDMATGKKGMHELERINQVQMIAAAQHRKGFMNPFPVYDEDGSIINHGRIANLEIFNDYFYDTTRSLVHNDLKNNLENVVGNTSSPVSAFMIDHIKATFGMLDIDAGAFGIDYSNPTVAAKLTSIMKTFRGNDYEVTPEEIHRIARAHSMLISGNLLQLGSTLNNHFQRISVWIEAVDQDWQTVSGLMHDIDPRTGRVYADVIAEASGSTEVAIGLADSLLSMMSDDLTMGAGFFSKKDLAILWLSKKESLAKFRKSKIWRSFFNGLLERQQGIAEPTAKQLDNIYMGTWRMLNGIMDNSLNDEDIKFIQKKFEGLVEAELINRYASWGLSGGYMAGVFSKDPSLKGVMTFAGVEEKMRKWTAVNGAVMAVRNGAVPQDVIDDPAQNEYIHPNALKMARILNSVTMFGLSPQFLPQAFRGGVGQLLFKFKPYQWHQGRREMITAINWFDSLSGADKKKIMKESLLLMVPPYLGVEGMPGTGKKNVSEPHEKFRRLLWSRVLISFMFTPMFYVPGITELSKFIRNQFHGSAYGAGARAAERGAESVWASGMFKGIQWIMALGGILGTGFDDEDDEEKAYQEWYRFIMPFYINLAIEFGAGRPLNAVRAYSQTAYRLVNAGKGMLEWAGLAEFED